MSPSRRRADSGYVQRSQVRTEPGDAGRTANTRATLYGDQLVVTTTGPGGTDFAVTFAPLDDGRNLRVTRRSTMTVSAARDGEELLSAVVRSAEWVSTPRSERSNADRLGQAISFVSRGGGSLGRLPTSLPASVVDAFGDCLLRSTPEASHH